jgi:hypothetical protein
VIPSERLRSLWGRFNATQAWFDEHYGVVVTNNDATAPTILPGEIDRLRFDLEDFHKFAEKAFLGETTPENLDDRIVADRVETIGSDTPLDAL